MHLSLLSSTRVEHSKARADAVAERVWTLGAKDATDLIVFSQIAIELAKMDKAGAALVDNAKHFFGEVPRHMSALILKDAI